MEAFRYRIVTEWSDEDRAFIGRVPALEGCSAHGDTPEEAAKQAREAALAILESMRDHRETAPPPDASADYSGQLRLRLPKSLHERIARLATVEGLSINSLLLSMLGEAVGQRRISPKATRSRSSARARDDDPGLTRQGDRAHAPSPAHRGYSVRRKAAVSSKPRKQKASAGSTQR